MSAAQRLVVVGQGYVGLPLAVRAAEVGFDVVGHDIDERRLKDLAAGRSAVEDVSDERLASVLTTGRYRVRAEIGAEDRYDVAVIAVPTPLRDRLPDLAQVESAAMSLAPALRSGATVILESTTYPGTTEELIGPRLARATGLVPGVDFHLGYSPERIDPGNRDWTLETTPKVVSGLTPACLRKVNEFYGQIVETTVPVASPREAELCKLLENTFRHVNIALVNEMAMFADELDVDIWQVVEAAATKPFGFMSFSPGPGVGGHCLPIDPSYLSWKVEQSLGVPFRFVDLANDINQQMPDYVLRRITRILNRRGQPINGARIVLVGYAYKRDTGDARESPALRLASALLDHGAHVVAVDPHVEPDRLATHSSEVAPDLEGVGPDDGVVILVDHDATDLDPAHRAGWVLDTRGVAEGPNVERL